MKINGLKVKIGDKVNETVVIPAMSEKELEQFMKLQGIETYTVEK